MQAAHYPHTVVAATNSEADTRLWFAVRVKSNREKFTATALRGQGYESFLPLYRPSQTVSDSLGNYETPLFPGYVFARFDKEKRLPILMLSSVVHVVGIGREPMPIDNAEIASIRTIVSSPIRSEPSPYLNLGERVSIVSGPLTGARGVIVAIKNGWRLVASITLLQRSISVEIDRAWVERCVQPHTQSHLSDTRNCLRASPERVKLREV
jgi:transcriptional antiterminator NusG